MRHEDGKQGRTASPSLHLLLLLLSLHGSSARTVIIGRGRIIADLGEPPAPTLPRIGWSQDGLQLKKRSRVIPSYTNTPQRKQEQVEYWTPKPPGSNGHAKPELPRPGLPKGYPNPTPGVNQRYREPNLSQGHPRPELPTPGLQPHSWPYRDPPQRTTKTLGTTPAPAWTRRPPADAVIPPRNQLPVTHFQVLFFIASRLNFSFKVRPIGGHDSQDFGSQIDQLIESLKSPGHTTRAPLYPIRAPEYPTRAPEYPTRAPEYPTRAPEYPTRAPEYPTRAPHTSASHPYFPSSLQPSTTTSNFPATPTPSSFYYPLFQFHNKFSDKVNSQGHPRTTPRPAIVTWRPKKEALPERPKGNQFVGGTSLTSNIAVWEEEKYRPGQQHINGDSVVPEMAGGLGTYPDYGGIEYIDYIEGPNIIYEMNKKTSTKRPAITFFPPSTAYPTQQPTDFRPQTYKPQYHFPTTEPIRHPQYTTGQKYTTTTRPPKQPQFTLAPYVPNQAQATNYPSPTLSPNSPYNPILTFRPTFRPTTRPTPRPTSRPTVVTEPTMSFPSTTPQVYQPQFNPLFTQTTASTGHSQATTSQPFSYPVGPFAYKPTYRPGFHLTPTRPPPMKNPSTRSTPRSPYKPTFKPAILATFAPSISNSLLPFSNTTASPFSTPYPFATFPFPILPDFDPVTNKPAEFIDSLSVPSTTPYYPTTQSTTTQETTTATTSTTSTTPEPDVVTIPGLPGVAIPSTPAAWVEYFTAGIKELAGIFRASLVFGQSAEGQAASEELGAQLAVLGLPLVTGGLSILGAGPAAVIAVAWLLPVASLLLLPSLAG